MEYYTQSSFQQVSQVNVNKPTGRTFSVELSALRPETKYYYRTSVIFWLDNKKKTYFGEVKTFMENGDEIKSDKFITTGNIGAGVRLFDRLEAMLNFNVPWKVIADNTDDFKKMGDMIGDYKTVQFVVSWRF